MKLISPKSSVLLHTHCFKYGHNFTSYSWHTSSFKIIGIYEFDPRPFPQRASIPPAAFVLQDQSSPVVQRYSEMPSIP